MFQPGRIVRAARGFGVALAAWLPVDIAVGGAAGFAIAVDDAPSSFLGGNALTCCVPKSGLFDQVETNCASPIADFAWFIRLGVPRLFISGPAIAATSLLGFLRHGFQVNDLEVVAVCLALSAPVGAVCAFGLTRWRRRSIGAVAACLLAEFCVEVARLSL